MVNEFPDPSNVPILSYHLISVPVVVNVVVPPTHIVSFVNGGNCGAGLLITTNGSEVAVPQYVVEVQEYVPPETRIDCVVSRLTIYMIMHHWQKALLNQRHTILVNDQML